MHGKMQYTEIAQLPVNREFTCAHGTFVKASIYIDNTAGDIHVCAGIHGTDGFLQLLVSRNSGPIMMFYHPATNCEIHVNPLWQPVI